MEDPIIVREYVKHSAERGSRSELAYRAFKKMAEDEDFLRRVAGALAEHTGMLKKIMREHMRRLVDKRYMDARTIGLILALHECVEKRGDAPKEEPLMVTEKQMEKYKEMIVRMGYHKGHATWRTTLQHAGFAKIHPSRGGFTVKEADPELLRGYVRFLRELLGF